MIESVAFQHFRSHQELKLSELGRINLLIGRNNSGKTAVLEGLFLSSCPAAHQVITRLSEARSQDGASFEDLWSGLFYDGDYNVPAIVEWSQAQNHLNGAGPTSTRRFTIRGQQKEMLSSSSSSSITAYSGLRIIEWELNDGSKIIGKGKFISDRGRYSNSTGETNVVVDYVTARGARAMSEEAQRFSQLEVDGKEGDVLEALRLIDPDLSRLTVVAKGKSTSLYGGDASFRLMPLSLMGDGMIRVLSITLSLVHSSGGILLIDEAENGLHYSVQESLWRLVIETAHRLNVQVFATTHSEECLAAVIRAAHQVDKIDSVRAFRFERAGHKTDVVDYNAEEMASALAFEQEMR